MSSGVAKAGLRESSTAWRELLRTTTQLLHELEVAGDFGDLSVREYDLLRALAESGGHRLGALAEAAYLPQPSMSRLVGRLERRGLVERRACEDDARGVVVHLTEAGSAAQREVGRRHVRSLRTVMSVLAPEELATLTALLARLRTEHVTPPRRARGVMPGDASTPPRDVSTPPRDARTPPRDVSTPPGDASTPPRDASTPPRDVSTPPRDASTPPRDVSTPPRDAGTPEGSP